MHVPAFSVDWSACVCIAMLMTSFYTLTRTFAPAIPRLALGQTTEREEEEEEERERMPTKLAVHSCIYVFSVFLPYTCVRVCFYVQVCVYQNIAGKQTDRTYTFDKSFGPATEQEQLYNTAIRPIVDEVLDGFNCTIFAYGQTGTGKTYTVR